MVALFNAPQCWATGKGSFGDYFGWQASTAARVAHIKPELAQSPPNSN
jgi:hypothetical protein